MATNSTEEEDELTVNRPIRSYDWPESTSNCHFVVKLKRIPTRNIHDWRVVQHLVSRGEVRDRERLAALAMDAHVVGVRVVMKEAEEE